MTNDETAHTAQPEPDDDDLPEYEEDWPRDPEIEAYVSWLPDDIFTLTPEQDEALTSALADFLEAEYQRRRGITT